MNEADALARLRTRFPGWAVSVERGMWRASGMRRISASSPDLLEAAMRGEPPFSDDLSARRVRIGRTGALVRRGLSQDSLARGIGSGRAGELGGGRCGERRGMRRHEAADVHTDPVIPRRARWIAYAVPLCVLPSSVFRLTLTPDDATLGEAIYIPALSAVSFAFALLALGLVRPWGETVPRWVPFAAGRTIPTRMVVVPFATAAVLITLLSAYGGLNAVFGFVDSAPVLIGKEGPDRPASSEDIGPLGVASYAPLLAWGPLLGVATLSYYRRRTSARPAQASVPPMDSLAGTSKGHRS
ncbi:hypothetical protein AB0K34_09505 [Actinomadura sp. NPDC049382]|uniref:hypothetical protein n=1 Tax=Actinomadura sp. NPDC049382 TaxID=3158220 RepID=UPI0034455989